MTVVVDPYGSLSVVYDRTGLNIQKITLTAGGGDISLQTPTSDALFVVDTVGFPVPDKLIMPSGADVGTVVEIFSTIGVPINIGVPTGEDINGLYTNGQLNQGRTRVIKYSPTSWAM